MQPLTLDATFDQRLVPPAGGRRYLRITVRAARAARPEHRKPLKLAFVLDRSGSMTGTKLRLVKEAVTYGIGQLAAQDRAALVVYDDEVTVLDEGARMTREAKSRLKQALSDVNTGGGTALGEGWLTGCRLIAGEASTTGQSFLNRALLLSDGLANVGITDPDELSAHAEELRRRGVTTSTFGVGADFDERLMSRLAESGGGAFYFIEHPRQIPDFFMGELGELLSVVAERLTLRIALPRGMRAELLSDFPVECDQAGLTVIGDDLSAGDERSFLLELHGPSGTLHGELPVGISLLYHDTGTDSDVELEAHSALRYAAPEVVATEPVDGMVLEQVGKVQAARAKRAALDEIYAGRFDEARAHITSAMGALAAPAMAPATAALGDTISELDQLAQSAPGGWDNVTRKQALYSSAVVSRSRRDYGKKRT